MSDPVVAERCRLESVVTLVDAVNGDSTLDHHQEAVKQAAVSDRLVLTKLDVADPKAVQHLRHRLQHLNPGAPVFSAIAGDIAPNQLFNAGLYDPATKSFDEIGRASCRERVCQYV